MLNLAANNSGIYGQSYIRNKIVHIDSDNRLSSSTSNEDFKVALPISIEKIHRIIPISVEIPLTFYNVNSSTNVITVTNATPTTFTVTLTQGNYTGSSLATEIQTQLNAQAFAGFTVTYSSTTSKFTIANATSFNLIYATTTASEKIGLTADSGLVTSWTGTNIANLLGYRYLYIQCQELSIKEEDITESFTGKNIFMKVPISGSLGSLMTYTPNQTIIIEINENTVRNLSLKLVDESFNVISLNGIPWSMTFQVVTQSY